MFVFDQKLTVKYCKIYQMNLCKSLWETVVLQGGSSSEFSLERLLTTHAEHANSPQKPPLVKCQRMSSKSDILNQIQSPLSHLSVSFDLNQALTLEMPLTNSTVVHASSLSLGFKVCKEA